MNATKVIQRIKDTLAGRKGPSPAVRGWLAKHGDVEIESISVCKQPIYSMIERIGNWLSQGKLKENMDSQGYENMMHLFLIVKLKNGISVKIEKNHVVEIKPSSDVGKQHLFIGGGGTVNALITGADKKYGEKLWKYQIRTANCQFFVLWFLGSRVTPEIRSFVQQDVAASLKDMGLLEKAASAITDAAHHADVLVNGAGRIACNPTNAGK